MPPCWNSDRDTDPSLFRSSCFHCSWTAASLPASSRLRRLSPLASRRWKAVSPPVPAPIAPPDARAFGFSLPARPAEVVASAPRLVAFPRVALLEVAALVLSGVPAAIAPAPAAAPALAPLVGWNAARLRSTPARKVGSFRSGQRFLS